MKDKTTVLGIMSGSSLDGLDLCLVEFSLNNVQWNYEIINSWTLALPSEIYNRLKSSAKLPGLDLLTLDLDYGKWIGDSIIKLNISMDLIALHGHTVFHTPEIGISLQIGNGEIINHITGIPTITNFRNRDIHFGGQGAPLVPMGEKQLFPEFDGFLNLGGICNGSFGKDDWTAGDIGPCNQVLNCYSELLGQPFDEDGQIAATGMLNQSLIDRWNKIDFFSKPFPKSLDNQWVSDNFLGKKNCDPADVLHTFSIFIAHEIANVLNEQKPRRTLLSGGGSYNSFLVDEIRKQVNTEIVIPSKELIEYKEALIFAFLGLLKMNGQVNVLSSCTGATQDTCSGTIHFS